MQPPQILLEDITKKLQVNDEIEDFIKCLKKADFEKAEIILDQKYGSWPLYYFDPTTGNSLIHIAIIGLITETRKIYEKLASLDSEADEKYQKDLEKNLIKLCFKIVKRMMSLNFPYHTINKDNHLPAELFLYTKIKNWYPAEIVRKFIKLFESSGQYLYPGRKILSDLNFFRSSHKPHKVCKIPDADLSLDKRDGAVMTLHQRQGIFERIHFLKYRKSQNLVILNVGFIVSDLPKSDPKHALVYITVPFKIKPYLIKATSDKEINSTHSEPLMCYYLKSSENIMSIIHSLQKQHPFIKGQKIYAIILDIHSTCEVCITCEDELHKLQSDYDKDSFLNLLEKILLNEFGYLLPSKPAPDGFKGRFCGTPRLKVVIRASGLEEGANPTFSSWKIPRPVLNNNPPRDIKTHPRITLFHLPPHFTSKRSSFLITDSDNNCLLDYKEAYRADSYEPIISRIFPKGIMSTQNYTAFSNSGSKAKDNKDDPELDHKCSADVVKTLMKI